MRKSTAEIRQVFLDFFYKKGHQIVPSSSLVPKNDPTLLFTNAGMNQFKDVFLGLDHRTYSRATTSQRCARAGGKHNDLEQVGYTTRHQTFFEMLGNFSFGDYFKRDAIQYAWELLTSKSWFNLQKERLWVTVYKTDDETYDIWRKEIGIPYEHIIRIGDNKGTPYSSDNFWQMGDIGPCGPCTEIFYDHGDHIWGGPPGSKEEHGDRYIEIWNIVFMEFNRQPDGTMQTLPKPSVDTGMGLERIAAVLQRVNSNYEIDLFRVLIEAVAKVIDVTDLNNKSLYVIADHIRSCAFLIADGVIPSNENRGYVLRRIIRRAIRHGKMLGAKTTFLYKLVVPLISAMESAGSELKRQQALIEHILKYEEEHFSKTLDHGLSLLDKEIDNIEGDMLDGRTAFRLYDTYGFPIDLTADICRERNIKVDEEGFKVAMEKQRHRARKSSCFAINSDATIYIDGITQFQGYDQIEINSRVIALFVNGKAVDSISIGQDVIIILDQTPFYPESGGQVGDKGEIYGKNFTFSVIDTQKYGQAIGHIGKLISGFLKIGEQVKAKVDADYRKCVSLNHTATHLMHAALREVLGIHVLQKGSLITDKILHFDFSHFESMKLSEIRALENLVNMKIRSNLSIETKVMNIDQVREKDVMALFSEKYAERVRVLQIGNFSTELCSGTHALRTGDIGLFHVISESGIASGIRRIKAVTGENAIISLHMQNDQLNEIAQLLKVNKNNLGKQVRGILKRTYQLEKELKDIKEKTAIQKSTSLSCKAIEIQGIKLLATELVGVEPAMMRTMVDSLKNQLGSTIIVLATEAKGKVFLIAGVSKDIANRVKAGELVSMVAQKVGGKGGGSSSIAQAAGTNVAALSTALSSIKSWVIKKLRQ